MKLRITSDVHTEFYRPNEISDLVKSALPELPNDSDTTLILAGDIGSMHKPNNIVSFVDIVAKRFGRVLYIPGNHEFYGGDLISTPKNIQDLLAHHENVMFTACGSVRRNVSDKNDARVRDFHMATLWTDMDKEDPHMMGRAKQGMNDYRHIRCGERLAHPKDTVSLHRQMLEMLDGIQEGDVVITHHLPTLESIDNGYRTSDMNGAYASDLKGFIIKKKPALWFNGHSHTAYDQMVGETRLIRNPLGYPHETNYDYKPELTVEV